MPFTAGSLYDAPMQAQVGGMGLDGPKTCADIESSCPICKTGDDGLLFKNICPARGMEFKRWRSDRCPNGIQNMAANEQASD